MTLESYLESSYDMENTFISFEFTTLSEYEEYDVTMEGVGNIWDSFVKFIKKIINKIKEYWKKFTNWISGKSSDGGSALKNKLKKLPNTVNKPFDITVSKNIAEFFTSKSKLVEDIDTSLDNIIKVSDEVTTRVDQAIKLYDKKEVINNDAFINKIKEIDSLKDRLDTAKVISVRAKADSVKVTVNSDTIKVFKTSSENFLNKSTSTKKCLDTLLKKYDEILKNVSAANNKIARAKNNKANSKRNKIAIYKHYTTLLNYCVKMLQSINSVIMTNIRYLNKVSQALLNKINKE